MKKFLLVLMTLSLSMGCTVCSASNLKNVENNPEANICNEKTFELGNFTLHLKTKSSEEQNEDNLEEDCFKNEQSSDDSNYMLVLRQKEDGTVEYCKFEMTLDLEE